MPLVVEGSTDLLTWTPLATNAMATSPVVFTDTNALVHYLFYRAVFLSSLPVSVALSNPLITAGNQFQMTLNGPTGTNLVLQSSSDLKTWTPISTNTAGASGIVVTDTNAPGTFRFYRAVTGP